MQLNITWLKDRLCRKHVTGYEKTYERCAYPVESLLKDDELTRLYFATNTHSVDPRAVDSVLYLREQMLKQLDT